MSGREAAFYCAGLITPFALLLLAVLAEPLLKWIEDADERAARRRAQPPSSGPDTDEIPAVDPEPSTVRLFDAWDIAYRNLASRDGSGRHRA